MEDIRFIIECKRPYCRKSIDEIKKYVKTEFEEGIVVMPPDVEIKAIVYKKLSGEIGVFNIAAKKEENKVLKKLKSIFHKK